MQEERKAPLPPPQPNRGGAAEPVARQATVGSAGFAGARTSSKNLQELQAERKMHRASMGAQVIASGGSA